MDEELWLTCADADQMLGYLLHSSRASERKSRLLTAASYRRLWHLFTNEPSKRAVEVSEAYADGLAGREEVDAAWDAAEAATAGGPDPHMTIYLALRREDELAAKCHLLRCIFGNPFRPVTVRPAWLAWNEAVVVRLARAAYGRRELPSGRLDDGRLAVLADALEEAGCTDDAALAHLRGPGVHVRGCWVVDLLLGKE
jgi:hypothetical protein